VTLKSTNKTLTYNHRKTKITHTHRWRCSVHSRCIEIWLKSHHTRTKISAVTQEQHLLIMVHSFGIKHYSNIGFGWHVASCTL